MYKNYRIALVIPAFNEGEKTSQVVENVPREVIDEIIVVNDGSQDETCGAVRATGRATIIHNESRQGIGFAIRSGLEEVLKKKFDVVVVMAGNGKDNPRQIPCLLDPIVNEGFDYVQGSRYLKGGEYGDMPMHRFLFTRAYSWAVRLLYGHHITDGTNGFRTYKLSILSDPKINLYQDWLREPLEYYLSLKVLLLKLRILDKLNKQIGQPFPLAFLNKVTTVFYLCMGHAITAGNELLKYFFSTFGDRVAITESRNKRFVILL